MTAKPIASTGLYQKYQQEVENYKTLKLQTAAKLEKRTRLDTSKNENSLLLVELNILEEDAVVYKKSGPILVKVDAEEAKTDVKAKMNIISDQIQQIDTQIKNIENKIQDKESTIGDMQQKLQAQIAMTQQMQPK
eukprot:262919_1